MKLLYCKKCHDVFNLQIDTKRCECGAVEGRYIDGQNADYSGDAIPFAIDNHSFMARTGIDGRPSVNSIYEAARMFVARIGKVTARY